MYTSEACNENMVSLALMICLLDWIPAQTFRILFNEQSQQELEEQLIFYLHKSVVLNTEGQKDLNSILFSPILVKNYDFKD